MRIDAQQAAGLHVAEGVFRFVHLREDRNAALVEGRAVQCRCDMPSQSLDKPNANIVFQLLDRSVAVDRASPRSDAAAAKLRRSTIRMKSCMRSSRSMVLFNTVEFSCQSLPNCETALAVSPCSSNRRL